MNKLNVDAIIVVGLNRSGTKWLSNILSLNNDVAAVTLPHQFGILESNALNDFSRVFKNIDRDDDYAGFVCMWAETDYVRSTGFDRSYLLSWQPRPKSVFAALSRLLDDFRQKQGKSIWLQKCSPSQSRQFQKELASPAKVVAIRRNFNRILESSIALKQQTGVGSSFLRDLVINAIQERILADVSKQPNTMTVDFESLKAEPEATVRKVCEFIGIEFSRTMLKTPFEQNTSFEKKTRTKIGPFKRLVSLCVRSLFALLPVGLVNWMWAESRARAPLAIVRKTYHELLTEASSSSQSLDPDLQNDDLEDR